VELDIASEAPSGDGTTPVVESDRIAKLSDFTCEIGTQAAGGSGDQGNGVAGAFHDRIPSVRATARTFGISWVRRRSVFPRRAKTAKRDSAERTSS